MERMKKASKVGLFGVFGNLFLMCIKLFSGIVFSSQAMIADGVNSTMDIFASLMTVIGGKISEKPCDEDHPFGHGKAEFLFSLFVGLSMIMSAGFIFRDSIKGIFAGHIFHFSYLLIFVCIITMLIKFALFLYSNKVYKETGSILVYSNMLDHRNDIIITFFTFISIILAQFQIYFFDSLTSIGISIWIFISGLKIFLDSYSILMDQAMSESLSKKIKQYILKNKNILGITKFETIPVGYQYVLVLSILVEGNLSTYESHYIADSLKRKLLKRYRELSAVTIHVNPYEDIKK